MLTIYDLSRSIHTMVASKQYSEALDYFKKHKKEVEIDEISHNVFLIADILTALRGIKAYKEAFQFLNIYGIKIDSHVSVYLLNSYGWLLYFQYKTLHNNSSLSENKKPVDIKLSINENNKSTASQIDKLENQILSFFAILNNVNESYSLKLGEYLFKLIIYTEKARVNTNWVYVSKICQALDPNKLSSTCDNVKVERKGQQKDIELASPMEEWFSMFSKALFETGAYKQCIEICEQALLMKIKMHYDNEIWFERRRAQCLIKTKEYKSAIDIYLKLILKKQDWFMLKELSECYYNTGEHTKALNYALKAVTAYGPISFKVDLIELIGDILVTQNEKKLANRHYMLTKIIRENEKWKVDKALIEKIVSTATNKDQEPEKKEILKAKLINYWKESVKETMIQQRKTFQKNEEKICGTITKLLFPKDSGVDGFVKSDNGKSAYFFIPKNVSFYDQLKVGLRIQYTLQPADKGDKAIKIKLL